MRVGILEAGQDLTARPREFVQKAYAKRQARRGLLVKLTVYLYRRVGIEEARLARMEKERRLLWRHTRDAPEELFGLYFEEPERHRDGDHGH